MSLTLGAEKRWVINPKGNYTFLAFEAEMISGKSRGAICSFGFWTKNGGGRCEKEFV